MADTRYSHEAEAAKNMFITTYPGTKLFTPLDQQQRGARGGRSRGGRWNSGGRFRGRSSYGGYGGWQQRGLQQQASQTGQQSMSTTGNSPWIRPPQGSGGGRF